MKRVEVVGIRVDTPTTNPVLLLKVDGENVHIPVWIGAPEAATIALLAEGEEYSRPLTHDLLLDVIGASGRALDHVEITALRDNIYEAALVFDDGGRIDSRTSDAVTLAIRAQLDILVADEVVEAVGEPLVDEAEDEVAKFREFLDHVSAEDFDEPDA